MIIDIIRILLVTIVLFLILKRFLPVKDMKVITGDELRKILESKNKHYQFIDVSIPREYNGYHIEGFENIPLRKIRKEGTRLDKDKETIIICQSGHISKEAVRRLQKLGFTKLTIVKGGISLWRD